MRIEWQGSTGTACIHVYNAENKQIAYFSAEDLDQHILAKRLSSRLLIDRSPGAEARLARILVLLACAQSCKKGVYCLARDCPLHPSQSWNQEAQAHNRQVGA